MNEPIPLPCPFCGGTSIHQANPDTSVYCEDCNACSPKTIWNTRHTPDAAPKVDEQLENDIELIQVGCPITTDDMELFLSAIARTILHLLKR